MKHNVPPPKLSSPFVADQLLRIATLPKPPSRQKIVENLGIKSKKLDDLIKSYREQMQAYYDERVKNGGQQERIWTVNERIVDDALGRNIERIVGDALGGDPNLVGSLLKPKREELMKMRREELVGFFDRFDWRFYAIVPSVRNQHPNRSCWAYAATEALESSLMIQHLNFAADKYGGGWIDMIKLNVHSTSDCVTPYNSNLGGRHEDALNYYLMAGIPYNEITINDIPLDNKIAPSGEDRDPKPKRAKTVGWDYVIPVSESDPPTGPWDIPEIDEMKKALLEHGPLVVAINSDKAFQKYGVKFRGNGTFMGKDSITGARFEKNEETGDLFVRIPARLVSIVDDIFLQIETTDDNKIRAHFLAEAASVFKHGLHSRITEADQPIEVIYSRKYVLLKFPKSNGLQVEDAADGTGAKLFLPKNTDAQFTTDSATGNFVAEFLWQDSTPIYMADPELDFNHFVLLIGWDDKKCAWIIQNTYGKRWGIGCDFEGSLQGGEDYVEDYETTGGYAYVGYNTIGHFAAWVEASLIEQRLEMKFEVNSPETA